MKVKSITLHNIGQFKELTIPLAPLSEGKPKVTVFIGNNGSGKTTVLKSLVTVLSWLPARIRNERGRGLEIPEYVIMNGEFSGMVSLHVENNGQNLMWRISKVQKGKKNQFATDVKAVDMLANIYRSALTESEYGITELPIIILYTVERSVLDIPLKIKKIHGFEQLEAYDNSWKTGIDFRIFFEWFRNQEDIENEVKSDVLYYNHEEESRLLNEMEKVDNQILMLLTNIFDVENPELSLLYSKLRKLSSIKENIKNKILEIRNVRENTEKDSDFIQLKSVKQAIQNFTEFENIWVQRKPLRMMVKKNNQNLNVFQLSQGEKSLMALVGDIARRLVMLNPNLENPLEGQGVVIIDEADLHLHPQWQRQLIMRLTKTFPNCQFILSTHSPLVISDSKDIVVYSLENGEMRQLPSQYGQDANTVLLNVMDTAIRNEWITEQLNKLIDLIQDNQLNLAKEKLAKLKQELPENHLELYKVQLLLKKQEIRNEKNSQNK